MTGTGDVAEKVDEAVQERPWLQNVARAGWGAKGVVYALMGGLALTLAIQRHTDDPASPEGAMGYVASQTGGRLLLIVLSLGLVLYVAWRVISVFAVRGNDLHAVLDRVGYGFSALFYTVLAVSAFVDVLQDREPDDSRTVERLSKWAMEHPVTRVLLIVAGVVVIGVGIYFIVRSFKRDYTEGLKGVHRCWADNRDLGSRIVFVTGAIGWFGRGLVTAAVGFFVARGAWRFDPNDARGYDRALKQMSAKQPGATIVGIAGALLIVYGAYCLFSAPRRELTEPSS